MAKLQRLRGPHSSSVTERRRLRERADNAVEGRTHLMGGMVIIE